MAAASESTPKTAEDGLRLEMAKQRQALIDEYKQGHKANHFTKKVRDLMIVFIDKIVSSFEGDKDILAPCKLLRSVLIRCKKKPYEEAKMMSQALVDDFKDDAKDLQKFDTSMFEKRTNEYVKQLDLLKMCNGIPKEIQMELFVDVSTMYTAAVLAEKRRAAEYK